MGARAIAYIDGYNLYYGLLKDTPYKWLDLHKFSRSLIREDFDLDGLVPIQKLEENRSDVNLAVAIVADAALDKADCLVVITGDSDQVGAIDVARHVFGKTVVVFNPHATESQHLKGVASYYKNIPRDLPAKCQLPDAIPYGKRGDRFIHRPPAWR